MAKKKASALLSNAKVFVNELDEAIEKEVYSNADTIEIEAHQKKGYLQKAHRQIIEVLDIKNSNDSKYFDYQVFKEMVGVKVKLRVERRKKAEEKRAKEEAEREQKEG